MFRVLRRTISILALVGLANSAFGFSLQGPFASWQVPAIGYNVGNVDIGGPMNLGEEYRWNVKTITYGFDQSFLNYFGQRGVDEVNKAIAFYNNLPPFSKMSRDLSEFPLDTRKQNLRASTDGLLDLKTTTMGVLAVELGLADPERYVFTLRNRQTLTPPATNWFTVMRNFDPVTLVPSKYVNGNLYTYQIFEGVVNGNTFAATVQQPVGTVFTSFNSVAGIADGGNVSPSSLLVGGSFFTGLTRDDVGGLRYIYRKTNQNVENLLPNSSGGGGAAWTPVGNVSNVVDLAIRPGIDKINFKLVKYFGQFQPITNTFTETVISVSNNPALRKTKQRVQRAILAPDIIFTAGDLGINNPNGDPVIERHSVATGWLNNSTLNNIGGGVNVEFDGPGVIPPSIIVAFTTVGLFFQNSPVTPPAQGEFNSSIVFGGWAAFDGTTNDPVVFPNGASIFELEQRIRQGGL